MKRWTISVSPVKVPCGGQFAFAGRTVCPRFCGRRGHRRVGLRHEEYRGRKIRFRAEFAKPFDTGSSMQQIIYHLREECGQQFPEVRIATPYFKPANNVTDLRPDYYLHQTDQWLVFPHELKGLSEQELLREKPGIAAIKHLLIEHLDSIG